MGIRWRGCTSTEYTLRSYTCVHERCTRYGIRPERRAVRLGAKSHLTTGSRNASGLIEGWVGCHQPHKHQSQAGQEEIMYDILEYWYLSLELIIFCCFSSDGSNSATNRCRRQGRKTSTYPRTLNVASAILMIRVPTKYCRDRRA